MSLLVQLATRRKIRPFARAYAVFMGAVFLTHHAHAQAIDDITEAASGHVLSAWSYGMNAFCWVVGGILLIMCAVGWYQHQRNPNAGSRPGMLVAAGIIGGVLLALPFFAKTASFTVFNAAPTVTGAQQQMKFDK